MNIEQRDLILPEGVFNCEVQIFTEQDRPLLFNLYNQWHNLNLGMNGLNARNINLPEGISECAFCIEMDAVRPIGNINGANRSWDCYNINTNSRVQIKACSVIPDLTSFGPRSQWDELYFIDFFRTGNWDGMFDIYSIPNDLIYNHRVNRNQTFRDQQALGRRPRLSIWTDIIQINNIPILHTGNLL